MNNITEEDIDCNDIFHYIKGEYTTVGDHYHFLAKIEDKNIKDYYYETDDTVLIPDPALDSNFKAIFSDHPKRLENFLNSIYFNPHSLQIFNIEYLKGEFYKIGHSFNINTLRADIACKGKVCAINNNNENETKETLLDIEIQINWIEDLDDRLFEYGSLLRNHYTNQIKEEQIQEIQNKKEKGKGKEKKDDKMKKAKRIYLDTLVIALIVHNSPSKLTNMIRLKKKYNGYEINMDKLNILEINVFNLSNPFLEKPKILGQPLSKDGIDWIKLISLRSWAVAKEPKCGKYIFPKLLQGHKYSSNEHINGAIKELILGNRISLTHYIQMEIMMDEREKMGRKQGIEEGRKEGMAEGMAKGRIQGMEEGKKEGEKKAREAKLASAYLLFFLEQKIESFNLEYTYKINEIRPIIEKEVGSKLDNNIFEKFISALIKNNAISK